MKHAYLKELQSRLLGSLTDTNDAIEHFSTDQSIYTATPTAIVYPQNTADVRKTVQFAAERAAAGKPLALVPRGKGSDQGGGAVGEGLQIVFPAHMNKLIRLDHDTVTVQPGIIFSALQQTLVTHGRYIPQFPSGGEYSTVGGLVASDCGGERTVKYGTIRQTVKGLKVVLADGSLIETRRISARELNRKKGLSTLEGELYRKFDSLLLDNADLIRKCRIADVPNSAGYDLWSVPGPKGSFDLTQVFIGSQGTLGLITEIILKTAVYSPRTTLLVGYFGDIAGAGEAVIKLKALEPSAIELVDRSLLEFHEKVRPGDLEGLVPAKLPNIVLLVQFDNQSQFAQKLRSTRAERLMHRHGGVVRVSTDPVEQVALWKLRRTTAATWMGHSPKKAVPFIEDAAVPVEKLPKLLERTYKLLESYELDAAIWGHAGTGNIRLEPRLDLAKKKDVERLIKLSAGYAELVKSLGGTTSATHNDSLLRAAGLSSLYGEDFYELLAATKHIFDPEGLFNPTKKTGATLEYVRAHLRPEFSVKHIHDFLVYT